MLRGAAANCTQNTKAEPHGSEKSSEKNRNEIRHSLCMPHGRVKTMPHGSEKSPEKNRNEIRHSLCMPHGRVKIVANYEENDT